jgi:integrase/recombinase XerD
VGPKYASQVGIDVDRFGPPALRAIAITNALEHEADLEKVQDWVGHANIATTRMYDRRHWRAEDSPHLERLTKPLTCSGSNDLVH